MRLPILLNKFREYLHVHFEDDHKVIFPNGNACFLGTHGDSDTCGVRIEAKLISLNYYALFCAFCGRIPGTEISVTNDTLEKLRAACESNIAMVAQHGLLEEVLWGRLSPLERKNLAERTSARVDQIIKG